MNFDSEEVLLENVELILEAFDYLRLPFALTQGKIWSAVYRPSIDNSSVALLICIVKHMLLVMHFDDLENSPWIWHASHLYFWLIYLFMHLSVANETNKSWDGYDGENYAFCKS